MAQQISEWVVRGGLANVGDLQKAYGPVTGMPGVYGFSVQYAPGVAVDDLIKAGNFPHTWVCWADRIALENAVLATGYVMLLIRSGRPYHHDLAIAILHQGVIQASLPDDIAQALSAEFQKNRKRLKP